MVLDILVIIEGRVVLGLISLAVFTPIGLGGVISLLRNRNLLEFDDQGISGKLRPLLHWTDLGSLRISHLKPRFLFWTRPNAMRVLAFVPKDPAMYVKSLTRRRRTAGRLSTRIYGSPVTIIEAVAPMSLEAIVEAIRPWTSMPVEYPDHQEQQR